MDVPVAANTLGTIGAVCWSIQLIPQIIINYRRHNTIGLQRSMMLLWACAGVPLGAYNIAGNFNIALQIQPQILTVLSLITWIQCFHYDDRWRSMKCCMFVGVIGALLGGVEAGLVLGLKEALKQDRHWPVTLMGVVSNFLLSAGVLRHYYDIYVHRTVRGISFIFVGIDAAGDVFSFISVFFQPKLDVLGMVIYATEFVLWCGVFACGGYFNMAPWIRQKMLRREINQTDRREHVAGDHVDAGGNSSDLELTRAPSSTSVFRTPRLAASSRSSIRSRTVD
ncbi:G protein-like protein-coupled receptor : PQ-loop [Lipomyces tetrasporus]|uniref:G protein-like protein-coupled receptor: PQ-loop n=1 Tax=Lipomyces tetrasporus TaxID=54092 RepID=A0AAD7QYP6_9ASCO|nr:G protein-like protein-coupled receptor : PQ-loop [Lipomyces tetrasporus]KAJ8103902.1 G protein-like protein-coupled receptor : PQ-loop [Lipomyces tetrasporus]